MAAAVFFVMLFSPHGRTKHGALPLPHGARLFMPVCVRRSGKIMRRLLRKIAVGDDKLGDTSTLADPSVVDTLIEHRGK